jgi:Cdc6-like AAA superfamily ATPase
VVGLLSSVMELLVTMARKPLTDEDWPILRFEAGELFTPSSPIATRELFAGRQKQINKLLDVVGERGRHAIIYGEPGVGKTSIVQILKLIIPTRTSTVRYIRRQVFSSDTFSTIWIDIFREMKFVVNVGNGLKEYSVSDLYPTGVKPIDVVRELSMFSENDIPIVVIDEYNLIKDEEASKLMAETIKAMSDASVKATVIIVGIGDSVGELIGGHESILRCSEEILMPRMEAEEVRDVIEGRLRRLGMKIGGDAKWKAINLTKGLPAFAHGLGRGAALAAIRQKRLEIIEIDVDQAIDDVLNSSQHTLKTDYQLATHSNQVKARYRQILMACAMAQSDEIGYFTPKQVEEPLGSILEKKTSVEYFNKNLREFTESKRGRVLDRQGVARIYRYRFRNPAMQPYVLMQGIKDGFLNKDALTALNRPEQPSLFPTGY